MPRRVERVSGGRGKMTTSTAVLPSYQRFANGVPVPLFSRRSFRPREKYLILLVFLTFGVVCFGAFFFLPDFRTGGAAVNSVYRVYQRMQKAGPDLLLPVPPRAPGDVKDSRSHVAAHPNAVPPGHEDSDHQDVHLVEDKQKLQVRSFPARAPRNEVDQMTLSVAFSLSFSLSRPPRLLASAVRRARAFRAFFEFPPAKWQAAKCLRVTGGRKRDAFR